VCARQQHAAAAADSEVHGGARTADGVKRRRAQPHLGRGRDQAHVCALALQEGKGVFHVDKRVLRAKQQQAWLAPAAVAVIHLRQQLLPV
jgi:hypothetical protein